MKRTLGFFICSAAAALAGPSYEVHEWGTFTTVAGSDGELLAGLDREEERLPAFVHSHYGFENGQTPDMEEQEAIWKKYGPTGFGAGSKGLASRPLTGVTVKMETPVIYFHSPEALHATVKVGFEGGTISQWYPARTKGDVPPMPAPPKAPVRDGLPISAWTLQFSQDYHGSVQWDVDVLSPAESADKILFKPGDTLSWLRARVPGTNVVKTAKGETESYLFYRGVGHFTPGLTTTVDASETLHLDNRSGGKIPYMVAVERQPDLSLRWKEWPNGLEAGASADLEEKGFTAGGKDFAAPLYRAMIKGLADRGLTHDEARAMVETWWHSYFETPGLRVFWVLPEERLKQLLPLEISPAPEKIVRVLVGRSEVFRPQMEQRWMQMAAGSKNDQGGPWDWLVSSDRFGIPIRTRVATLQHEAKR